MSESYVVLETGLDVEPPAGASLDPDYDVVIGADASTNAWFDADNLVTMNGSTVSAVGNQKVGGGTGCTAVGASQPAIATAFMDGRNAFVVQRGVGALPKRLLYGAFPATGDWSKIILAQDSEGASPATSQSTIWGGAGAGGHRVMRNAGNIIHRVGTSGTEALVQTPVDWVLPHLIIATWHAATGKASLSMDGLPFSSATNASAVCSAVATAIGAQTNDGSGVGWNARIMAFSVDTLDLSDPANLAKLNWWKQLIRDDYPSMDIQ